MKSLLRSFLLLALLALIGLSCTTNTIVTNPAIAPTITRFSPDTVWTLQTLKIYGTNFGYDGNDVLVTIDTARANVYEADDTVMTVLVPEEAQSGLIQVRTYEQTTTSSRPVTIQHTFNPHSTLDDTIPEGAYFSIPGSGMNNHHGTLRLFLNAMPLPVDSVFPDRIVSHPTSSTYSGWLTISDDSTSVGGGRLYVTVPSPWKTLSQIWDRVSGIEYHHLTGFIGGGSQTIDSSWQDSVLYDRQIDINIAGRLFTKTANGVNYSLPASLPYNSSPLLQVDWDEPAHTASVSYYKHSVTQPRPFQSIDTLWYSSASTFQAPGTVGADIEFVPPLPQCRITTTTTDSTGSVNLQETSNLQIYSGTLDLILKR